MKVRECKEDECGKGSSSEEKEVAVTSKGTGRLGSYERERK